MFNIAISNYTNVNNGYNRLFGYYVTYIEKVVPYMLTNAFMWNISITGAYQPFPEIGYGMQCTFSFAPPHRPFPDCNPTLSYTTQDFVKMWVGGEGGTASFEILTSSAP